MTKFNDNPIIINNSNNIVYRNQNGDLPESDTENRTLQDSTFAEEVEQTKADTDKKDFWDGVLKYLQNLFDSGLNASNIEGSLNCEGNQIRGWKFFSNGKFIEFVECGCYEQSTWAHVLGLAVSAGFTTAASQPVPRNIILRRARKQVYSKVTDLSKLLMNGFKEYVETNSEILTGYIKQVKSILSIQKKSGKFVKSSSTGQIMDVIIDLLTNKIDNLTKKMYMDIGALARPIKKLLSLSDDVPEEQIVSILNEIDAAKTALKETIKDYDILGKDIIDLRYKKDDLEWVPILETVFPNEYSKGLDLIQKFIDSSLNLNSGTLLKISDIILTFVLFAGFIEAALQLISVVEDKRCGPQSGFGYGPSDYPSPKDLKYLLDEQYFNGKWLDYHKRDPAVSQALGDNPTWEQVRNLLIEMNLPVWPTFDENCNCSECPQQPPYNLCQAGTASWIRWADTKNICVPNTCCDQEQYNASKCACECPEGYEFCPCESGSCTQKIQTGSSFFVFPSYEDVKGYCLINPNPDKLKWNKESCSFECMDGKWIINSLPNNTNSYPAGVYYSTKIYVKYKPCENGKKRYPEHDCECGVLTPTLTPTPTPTATKTVTPSVTPGLTATVTPTVSVTSGLPATPTASVTATPTNTVTPSLTATATPTATPTVTQTATPTPTPIIAGQNYCCNCLQSWYYEYPPCVGTSCGEKELFAGSPPQNTWNCDCVYSSSSGTLNVPCSSALNFEQLGYTLITKRCFAAFSCALSDYKNDFFPDEIWIPSTNGENDTPIRLWSCSEGITEQQCWDQQYNGIPNEYLGGYIISSYYQYHANQFNKVCKDIPRDWNNGEGDCIVDNTNIG